jgi:hypothetical protein
MPNLIKELKRYVNNLGSDHQYKILHDAYFLDEVDYYAGSLNSFLSATMDEVRLRYAIEYAKKVLSVTDIDDFNFFSIGVLKREISGNISYSNQRDHSAHVLYNYLLGWYIFEHNDIIRNSFKAHCELRDINSTWKTDNYYHYSAFYVLWQLVSLLHDIGYLLEGSLKSTDISTKSDQIIKGTEFVNNYFKHHFWIGIDFYATNERQHIIKMANIREPELNVRSLVEVADSLRFLDNLEILLEQLKIENRNPNKLINFSLPGDAFTIWKLHYDFFVNDLMSIRIKCLQKSFEYLLNEGMGPKGVRLIDHGVCSGLLLLLSSTFYFKLYFVLKNYSPTNEYERYLRDRFINRPEAEYDALHWWQGVVWATAAVALHNIQQNNIEGLKPLPKLNINDDPLTYLGILVDIIQIWDRTSVRREKALSGDLPIQGIDINLSNKNNKIKMDYKDPDISKSIKNQLNLALNGWNDIVDIKP